MTDPAPRPWYIKHVWLLAAIVGVLSLTVLRLGTSNDLKPLAKLYKAPDFSLIDQTGTPFDSQALRGKAWIATMMFTSCRTECPAIGAANQELQRELKGTAVQLVSFTVDPEFDDPVRMSSWGRSFDASHDQWKLLTGPRAELEKIVIDGFKTHMGDRKESEGLIEIAHAMKLILIDGEGYIRHYFDATLPKDRELIVAYAKHYQLEAQASKGP